MSWFVCFFFSAAVLLAALLYAAFASRVKYREKCALSPLNAMLCGVLLSSVLIFIPIFAEAYQNGEYSIVEVFLVSVHSMVRLFVVDGEFTFVTANIAELQPLLYRAYSILASILFVLAPLITFGLVISIFKNLSAYRKYLWNYRKPAYIFSELNEKSLSLAESVQKQPGKCLCVFTDVSEEGEKKASALQARAYLIGAVCFRKGMETIRLQIHSKKSDLIFFAIGNDEAKNVQLSIRLAKKYKQRAHTHLYVFSTRPDAEPILSGISDGALKLRRINEVQALLYNMLYRDGEKLFENALPQPQGQEKLISAVIVGLGDHGTEMTRTLAWFCQMIGYRIEIHAFDESKEAENKLRLLCPELMDEAHNGQFTDDGEAQYRITVHGGIRTDCRDFYDRLSGIGQISYVLVALHEDEMNIQTSMQMRMHFERMGIHPQIQAVVRNTDEKELLQGLTNCYDQPYEIEFIGDRRSQYSAEAVIHSELEEEALDRHLRYAKAEEKEKATCTFWRYEYYRKSSMASAIHKTMKVACGVPGITLAPEEREEKDLWAIRKLEHRRWNAYMRSEGYVYSGSTEKASRNNLGKMHHCLVSFDQLSLDDQKKDDE